MLQTSLGHRMGFVWSRRLAEITIWLNGGDVFNAQKQKKLVLLLCQIQV